MKLLFISDIHGLKTNLNIIKEKFNEFKCEKLIVLGDLYYIGPKGLVNEDYDISYVKNFLESFKDKIICIRGNCDSDVDIMISEFPIINELGMICTDKHDIYLTHGHIYNENNWEQKNSILVYGHYHTAFIKEKDNNLFINPGSISLPRQGNPSFMIYNDEEFIIYDIFDNIIDRKKIK